MVKVLFGNGVIVTAQVQGQGLIFPQGFKLPVNPPVPGKKSYKYLSQGELWLLVEHKPAPTVDMILADDLPLAA